MTMEKPIKDVLVSKAKEAFEKMEISENELNSHIIIIKTFLKHSSDDTPEINMNFAVSLYVTFIKIRKLFAKRENGQNPELFDNVRKQVLNSYFEASDNYQKITDFEDRACNAVILIIFISLIDNAISLDLINDIGIETLEKMKNEAKGVYEKLCVYKNLPSQHDFYLNILLNISKEELNHSKEALEATLNEGKRVINNLEDLSVDERVKLTERFIVELTNEKKELENSEKRILLNRWLQIFIENNTIEKTSLEVLRDIFKKYEDNDAITKKLSTIYKNIQEIKQLLVVEDFKELKFGHYTNGEVLQILLDSKEKISEKEKEKYEITGKTRLYNVGYMNDPEEGKLLDTILGFHKSIGLDDKVSSSPWFLMSLTTAIDELTMWAQYGNNAEGVCLEFKPDSFLEVKSQKDLEWLTLEASKRDSVQKGNESSQENDAKSKDCLYRICYLDEDSLKDCEIKIKEEDNELLKDKKEKDNESLENEADATVEETRHSKIEGFLKKLKESINDVLNDAPVEEEKDELREDLDKLLEEIRYLFKSSAYSYEKELRLLKYAEISSKNHMIKVHKVKPAAKLYIEREDTIELNRIIFGPKFNKPEDVVPLVNLLDEQIKCERSSKKFR